MGNININGQSFKLTSDDPVQVKKIKKTSETEHNYKDDIVVKQSDAQLVNIQSDEIDIEGTWLKPYVGLPNKGDEIHFVHENGQEVKGTVVLADDENDALTYVQTQVTRDNLQKQAQTLQKNTQQWVDKTAHQVEKAVQSVDKKLEKTVQELREPSEPPTKEDLRKGLNTVADSPTKVVRDAVKELTGHTLTIGQTETYRKGDLTVGASVGKHSAISSSYTLSVKNLDEKTYAFGSQMIDSPHSRTLFVAHGVEARVGADEVTAGYKGALGVEFNLPNKNDFSVAGVGTAYAGQRFGEGAMVGVGLGIEGRYQVNDKITVYGGPMQRLTYSNGFDISPTFEAGVSFKFK